MPQEVTPLNHQEESQFQQWISANKITDLDHPESHYDYRGYWKEAGNKPVRFGEDHFPDTYKQHGHPTFSVESKYSKGPNDGGRWEGDTYVPQAASQERGPWEDYATEEDGPWKDYAKAGPSKTLLASRQAASKSEFEANKPESTIGSRAREAAIGVLEPFTAGSLKDTAKAALGAAWEAVQGKYAGKAMDFEKGLVTAPLEPVKEFASGVAAGDYDKAAHGAGGLLSQTAPALAGVKETTGDLNPAGVLREKARAGAQALTGSGASKTTAPIVEKFGKASERATRQQELAGRATAEGNAKRQSDAASKTAETQANFDASEAAKKATYQQEASGVLEANREAAQTASRVEGLQRSMQEGSKRLGEGVKNLDENLRSEANERYDTVKSAVKDDPGVPLQDLAESARYAEQNIIKGSPENIKQFRDLARQNKLVESGSPMVEGGVMIDGKVFGPDTPLFQQLQSEGQISTPTSMPFDQLQGYSSEIGAKLAAGNLPGDVYQALKYLKERIDVAKAQIADRNGAGAALRNADSFWRDYMDLFYDKESPIAKVRESVGTIDPQYYADPLVKGKSFDVAVGKLKRIAGWDKSGDTVTVYRGEVKPGTGSNLPSWIEQKDIEGVKAGRRWFTSNLENAQYYMKEAGGASHIVSTEVPRSVWEASQKAPEVKRYSLRPDEGFIPSEYVDSSKPISGRTQGKPSISKQANAIADLARNIKGAGAELEGTKVPKTQGMPDRPIAGESPKPVVPEVKPGRQVAQPIAPTAEDIVAAKRAKIEAKGQSFMELKPRDAYAVVGPLVAGLLGNNWLAGLVGGTAIEGVIKGAGYAMTRPRIVDWIARPTAADLAAIEKLPDHVKAQVGSKLREVVEQENAKRGTIAIAPPVQRLISNTGVIGAAPVKSRKEALELLGR